MDYEKAYKEALERAKAGKPLDEVFPELKESEDERIRKWIVNEIKATHDHDSPTSRKEVDDALAWLEKQKEQKPVKLNDDTEVGLNRALQIVRAARGNLSGYQSDDGIYECCHAIQTLERILENGIEQQPVECIEDSVKFKEGFKAGRESGLCDGQKYVLDNFDSYGLCKPAEWSEEDLQHKSWILECLADGKRTMPQYAADFHAAYNWLKSLRPQPHWKPSEEQMEYLAKGIIILGEDGNCKTSAVLNELRNDLQKLL